MNDMLDARQRKVVVISDPHIRKNDSYYVYTAITELE